MSFLAKKERQRRWILGLEGGSIIDDDDDYDKYAKKFSSSKQLQEWMASPINQRL
jgi:hypothetical protein